MCDQFAEKLHEFTADPRLVYRLVKQFKLKNPEEQQSIFCSINAKVTNETDKKSYVDFCTEMLFESDSESTPGAAEGSASRKRSEPTRTEEGQKTEESRGEGKKPKYGPNPEGALVHVSDDHEMSEMGIDDESAREHDRLTLHVNFAHNVSATYRLPCHSTTGVTFHLLEPEVRKLCSNNGNCNVKFSNGHLS